MSKETRNLVLECYVDGIIHEDDFMLLYDTNQSKNPEFLHKNYEPFNFDALDSRPGKDQRLVYNGHKRVHAFKFQSVSLPNGIIANLFGPVGRSEFPLHISAN